MGYFPNGSSGDWYVEQFCSRCIHGKGESGPYGCPVQMAHMERNYEECNNKDSILHMLIPLDEHHDNEQCRLFVDAEANQKAMDLKAEEIQKAMNSKISAIRKEVRDSWICAINANGQTEASRILEKMVDRIGYSRVDPIVKESEATND